MERRPLIIVGSGPAGAATALFLHARDPVLARETLILEKARHPRPKVCAGGLIPHTLQCLQELDVPLSVPNVVVRRTQVEVPGRRIAYEDGELCRVVRRDQFDQSLARAVTERGIALQEREKVVALQREGDGFVVETERATYRARAVVGADGSGSVVRRQLLAGGRECIGKAVMCDVPLTGIDWDGYARARYDFSFAHVPQGLRGYAWAFPCLIDGTPHANVGVYSVRAAGSGTLLTQLLRQQLERLGAPQVALQSFPIRWYAAGVPVAAPGVLVTGDAAGVDPLLGEGISFAFEYGRHAAAALAKAFAIGDWRFGDYETGVRTSWMGKKLRRLGTATRLFYGPTWRLWFGLAARSPAAQRIGLQWYNGVDGWDQRSSWHLLWAWLRSSNLRTFEPSNLQT